MQFLWYVYVRFEYTKELKLIKVKGENKYDLFAFIGYYYSVVHHIDKIERVDYQAVYVSNDIKADYDCSLIHLYYKNPPLPKIYDVNK